MLVASDEGRGCMYQVRDSWVMRSENVGFLVNVISCNYKPSKTSQHRQKPRQGDQTKERR